MSKFRPLADRILVLPNRPPVKQGGLAAPPSQEEEPTQGIVVAAGPGAEKTISRATVSGFDVHKGNLNGVAVRETVQWAKYAGRDVEHNGVKHRLLRLEEIEGVIEL